MEIVEARSLAQMLARLSRSGEVTVSPDKANYLKDYLECRTAAKGGRVLRCQDCGTHAVVYNACNRRGCPVCSRKNQLNWQMKMRPRLLPTSHHHLVFSFPETFTDQWLKHPKATVAQLFTGVRKALHKLETERKLTLGTVMVFQSHCRGLAYKAHVHCLVTDGGLTEDNQWQQLGPLPLAQMTKWVTKALGGSSDEKGWRIHESRHTAGGEAVIEYLGQRLNGSVVSAQEVSEHEETVQIQGRGVRVELAKKTFALRYLNHIPEKGTVLVRNCGLYSNRQKNRLRTAREQFGPERKAQAEEWEERCPRCKGKLETIINSRIKRLSFDHERCGFGVGPPLHWELSKAS